MTSVRGAFGSSRTTVSHPTPDELMNVFSLSNMSSRSELTNTLLYIIAVCNIILCIFIFILGVTIFQLVLRSSYPTTYMCNFIVPYFLVSFHVIYAILFHCIFLPFSFVIFLPDSLITCSSFFIQRSRQHYSCIGTSGCPVHSWDGRVWNGPSYRSCRCRRNPGSAFLYTAFFSWRLRATVDRKYLKYWYEISRLCILHLLLSIIFIAYLCIIEIT